MLPPIYGLAAIRAADTKFTFEEIVLSSMTTGNSDTAPNPRQMSNAIRALSMDAVQQANSGHPGAPMGMADIATVLFTKFLKFDPSDPAWPDRDRFVLSNGHGSMLLYSLLYLSGYDDIDIDHSPIINHNSPGGVGPARGVIPAVICAKHPIPVYCCMATAIAI